MENNMEEFVLTRKQVLQLSEIASKFPHVQHYTISFSNESGIGPSVTAKFVLFDDAKDFDATVDLTDLGSW